MAFKEIGIERLYEVPGRVLIDVRSPGEFLEGTIPGSVNVPLFTDEERALIGTVYKRESPAAARRLAMLTVSSKIPQIVEQMERLMQQGELVIYCWRGGMRSYAACTFMDLLKYPIVRLKGGYRAYRQLVMTELGAYAGLQSQVIVLHGLTGVGKTRALLMLKEHGHQVLDLEGMANHRGSVFGSIGLGESHNQKTFDSHLWEALRELDPTRPVFMEAESRRIGRSVMPEWLERDKKSGCHVLLEASMEQRVQRLLEDYLPHEDELIKSQLGEALAAIQRRISREEYDWLETQLSNHAYDRFCGRLLELYYDPKYKHKLASYQAEMLRIDGDDLEDAVYKLEALATELGESRAEAVIAGRNGI